MVGGKNVVQVLSRSAFHDTQLVCSGDLSYLGGSWSKNAGSAVRKLTNTVLFFKSPEQITHPQAYEIVNSDLYNLGSVLYFTLIGSYHPWGCRNEQIQNSTPNFKHRNSSSLFIEARGLIDKLLEKKPDSRYFLLFFYDFIVFILCHGNNI